MENNPSVPRYEPPHNVEAQQRLQKFRGGIREVQSKYTDIIGATLYGSMIKGDSTHKDSDIDGFIFFEGSNLSDITKERVFTELELYGVSKEELKDVKIVAINTKFLRDEIVECEKWIREHSLILESSSIVSKYLAIVFLPFIGKGDRVKFYRKFILDTLDSLKEGVGNIIWNGIRERLIWFHRKGFNRDDESIWDTQNIKIPNTLKEAINFFT